MFVLWTFNIHFTIDMLLENVLNYTTSVEYHMTIDFSAQTNS